MVFVDTNYSQCEELGFFTKKANIVLHKSTRCEAEHTRPSLCGLILANSDWSFPRGCLLLQTGFFGKRQTKLGKQRCFHRMGKADCVS